MSTNLKVIFPLNDSKNSSNSVHKIDIIFVHGLNPRGDPEHPEKTWTHTSGTMWPRDLLPGKIPYARIMVFSYNSNVALDVSESGVPQHANSLLELVQGIREDTDTTTHPLILVGHSLGGLVIKQASKFHGMALKLTRDLPITSAQALLLAKNNDRIYGDLRNKTKALVFFATPHRGGNGTTLGQIAANAATFFSGNLRNDLVESLRKNSKYLAQLSADFSHQYEDYDFISVVETRGLIKAPFRTIVVDSDSAILGLAGHREQIVALDKDHSQICKLTEDANFTRVARHMKRLADSAIKVVAPPNHEHDAIKENPGSGPVDPSTAMSQAASLTFFSTLDFMHREELIGQAQILQDLEIFVDNNINIEQCLLLKGAAGTGKSSIVYEFTSRCQGKISVFWFSAESPETLQQGFDRASYKLKPAMYTAYLRNHLTVLHEWLSNESHGRWILVFDNAQPGLDLRGIVPPKGGKVIITSRHTDVRTHTGFITRDVPPLSPSEAVDVFLSRWERLFYSGRRHHTIPPSMSPPIESLSDRPLAAVLAASCAGSLPLHSALEHLQILYEEDAPAPGNIDPKIWKWFSNMMEELSPVESSLLMLLAMFDWKQIPDDFLDALRAGTVRDHQFVSLRSIQRLVSLQLLQRQNDPSTPYLRIPAVIQDCLNHYLSEHGDQAPDLAREGSDWLSSAFNGTFTSFDRLTKFLKVMNPHCRAFCLSLKRFSIPPDNNLSDRLRTMSIYFLDKSISTALKRSTTQFWRTWMISNSFALPKQTYAEDDQTQYIEPTILPPGVFEQRDPAAVAMPADQRIRTSIYSVLWEDLKFTVSMGAIAGAWQGIREEQFAFVHSLQGELHDNALMREITNAIDKGGNAGLQRAVGLCLRDEVLKSELMDCMGCDTINEIAKLVSYGLQDNTSRISQDVIDSAVSGGLDLFKGSSFFEIGGAFDKVLSGQVELVLRSVLEPSMTSRADPESFERVTTFTVMQMSETPFRERVRTVAKGYWQVVGATQILFAASILNHMIFGLVKANGLHGGVISSVSQEEWLETLVTQTIEVVREGVMKLERRRSPSWRLSARRAIYWCLQAEASRTAWGSATTALAPYSYQNQDRWEEICILMEMTDASWPLV